MKRRAPGGCHRAGIPNDADRERRESQQRRRVDADQVNGKPEGVAMRFEIVRRQHEQEGRMRHQNEEYGNCENR